MNQPATLIESLNARELKILALIGEGLSYGEIGQALYIEKATVTWYVQQIYDKLGLEKSQRNHQKALSRAQDWGLLGGKPVAFYQQKAVSSIQNPYKGLRSFQQGDASEFFGREALIHHLLSRLTEDNPLKRFLAVVGPSGCGKSSVLHAGLIPALQRGGVDGSENWVIASMVPGSHPLDELEAALARVAARPGIDIMAQLVRDERGLQRLAGILLPEKGELLLLVDQFEEVFSQLVDEDQRTHFLALLGGSLNQPHSRVRVVIALRADYYDRPLMSPAISDLFRLRTEVVTPLSPDELAQAICLPAAQAGVQVEPGLVAALVDEVSERPGLLPLMQYTLTELFDRHQGVVMTLGTYHQIGGIRGALTRRAEVLYESLDVARQALLRQIFLRLVRLGADGEVLRRRVRRSELQSIERDPQVVDELIDELATRRLLTLDYDQATSNAMVELAHEALIREWSQLRNWLDDSREDIRLQRLLAAAASDWREANRDPSYLLSGAHLIQFQAWAQISQVELGPVESEFLTTSIEVKQHHDRRRRLIRNLVFGITLLVAAAMSILAFVALDRERSAHDEAVRADRRTAENRSLELASDAQAAFNEGRTDLALLLAMEAVDISDPPSLSEQTFRSIVQGPGIRAVFSAQLNTVTTISISPDKRTLLVGGCAIRNVDATCKEGRVVLLNIEGDVLDFPKDQQFIYFDSREFLGLVNDVVFNPADTSGGYSALTACEDGIIILWDISPLTGGKVVRRYDGHAGGVSEVAYSLDGKGFIAAYEDGSIILWDIESAKEIQRLIGGAGAITSVAISQDGKTAISASVDGGLILWDVLTGMEIRRYPSSSGIWVSRVAFAPVDKYGRATVWGLGSDKAVHIWDLDTAQEVPGIPPGRSPYRDIAFTRDGGTAALAFEGMVILRDTIQGGDEQRLIQINEAKYTLITALAISQNDSLLVSGDAGGTVALWNLPVRNDLETMILGNISTLGTTVLYPDGFNLLSSTGSADTITPTLYKIDTRYNQVDTHYPQLPNPIAPNGLAVDPAGRYILVGGGNLNSTEDVTPEEPFLWVIDAESRQVVQKLEGHRHNIFAVAISPDGRYALSGSVNAESGTYYSLDFTPGELFLWDLETSQIVREFSQVDDIQGIAFSHDGKLAVTCSMSGRFPNISVWEVATGKKLDGFPYGCQDAIFSHDDKSILISAITDSSLSRIFEIDVNRGEILRSFEGLDGPSFNIDLSPDGKYLFASSLSRALLWDMDTGKELSRFELTAPGSNTWAVFPRGDERAFIIQDNTDQLIEWHISQLDSLASLQVWIVKNRYVRPFTCEERELYNVSPLCPEE